MRWQSTLGSANLPQIKETLWPAVLSSFFFFCLLLAGLWEASRRAVEPSWIHELPARLQHGTLPRVSARSSLSSCYFLAPAPLHAAPTQRAHVLQHEFPRPRPSSSVHVPQGTIRVTCHITFGSARGNMIVLQMLHGKHSSAERMCIYSHLASVYSISLKHVWASPWHDDNVCNLWPWIPRVLCTACPTVGPSSPCDVSIADTNYPVPPLHPSPLTCPRTLFAFDCFLTSEYFAFLPTV